MKGKMIKANLKKMAVGIMAGVTLMTAGIVVPNSGSPGIGFNIISTVEAATVTYYYKACPSSCRSLVDGLKSIGVDSSYSNRKQIASLNGYSNYTGTASQNNNLLALLKKGQLVKQKVNTPSNNGNYYAACSSSCRTIVDGLNAVGVNSSYANRKQIAIANGISNYTGTASQNNTLLSLLKQGRLVKAGSSAPANNGSIPVNKAITVYSQTDKCWSGVAYGKGPNGKTAYLGESGCGVLALVNAVYYLNGQFIQPSTLASWSVSHGYRVNGVGTSYGLYKAFADSCGATYGIKYIASPTSVSAARAYLQNGNVCIIGVSGHIMCMVNYNSSTGKYLVLDSYRSSNRGTSSTGYRWMSEGEFTGKMQVSNIRVIGKR